MVGDAAMLIKKARPSRKNRKSPQGAGRTRFKSNQVPLIPASRGHNYANDLPPPASWFPPVIFFFFAIPHNAQPNSTALGLFPPYPLQGAYIIPSCDHFIYPLFLCGLWPFTWVLIGCLSHELSVSNLEAVLVYGTLAGPFRQSVMAIATVTASAVAPVGVVIAAVPFAV